MPLGARVYGVPTGLWVPSGLWQPHRAGRSPWGWGSPQSWVSPWGWQVPCGAVGSYRAVGTPRGCGIPVGLQVPVGPWMSGGCRHLWGCGYLQGVPVGLGVSVGWGCLWGCEHLWVPVGPQYLCVCGGPVGLQTELWVPVGLRGALGRPASPALEQDRVAGAQRSGLPSSFPKAAEPPQNAQGNALGGCGQEGKAEAQIGVPVTESRWAQGPRCRCHAL